MSEPTSAATPAAAARPAPLQPPSSLTLTAPEAPPAVALTQAPELAPAVDPAALPGLDSKVDDYIGSLLAADAKSPEFAAKSNDIRTMGDAEIRQAADTSNRLLQIPVKALNEGGLSQGSTVGTTLLE